jgi:hypothetical protein
LEEGGTSLESENLAVPEIIKNVSVQFVEHEEEEKESEQLQVSAAAASKPLFVPAASRPRRRRSMFDLTLESSTDDHG